MIRGALLAFGLSAGAGAAQPVLNTAAVVDVCGGTRLVLSAREAATPEELERGAEAISRRFGALNRTTVLEYTQVQGTEIHLSMPAVFEMDEAALSAMLERVSFGLHDVLSNDPTEAVAPEAGQMVVPEAGDDARLYLLPTRPLMTGAAIVEAVAAMDTNGSPAVQVQFSPVAAERFANITQERIGQRLAIVAQGDVITAPSIQTRIGGGAMIITGDFTVDEAFHLAAVLQGGVLPFAVDITAQEVMDGSDPSADFCP